MGSTRRLTGLDRILSVIFIFLIVKGCPLIQNPMKYDSHREHRGHREEKLCALKCALWQKKPVINLVWWLFVLQRLM